MIPIETARASEATRARSDWRHRAASAGPIRPQRQPAPRAQSQRGLDWFIFFLADVQTGFGPFVAVYLTTQKWTQVEIGFVLSIGGIVGLIGQMPGGAIVDAARSERLVAGLAVATIGMCALSYAVWPIFPVIAAAATLHARRAACSALRLPRSASVWSGRWRSANGSGATRALPRSAMARGGADGRLSATCCRAARCFVVTFHAGDPDLAGALAGSASGRSTRHRPMARSRARCPIRRHQHVQPRASSGRC